jgi:hypothetical protein
MKKIFFIIGWSMMLYHQADAQGKAGIEQYSYTGMPLAEAIVPVYHIQSANKWYAELRYNYEAAQTLSLFGGKMFSGGRELHYDLIPMLGFSTGQFTGISLANNTEATWKDFYFSSQMQYSMALKKNARNFLFNWSELGYNISPAFFSGLTVQYTLQEGQTNLEPGILAGFTLNKVSFPFYVFHPLQSNRYFILGINYEYNFKNKH